MLHLNRHTIFSNILLRKYINVTKSSQSLSFKRTTVGNQTPHKNRVSFVVVQFNGHRIINHRHLYKIIVQRQTGKK